MLFRYFYDEDRWPREEDVETDRPWLDAMMVLLAAVGVFAIGAAYRRGWLLTGESEFVTAVNLCIPYLPIFVVLAIRRQSMATVWLTSRALPWKLFTGLLAAAVGLLVFIAMRGEWSRVPQIIGEMGGRRSWIHAPAVFLEALAVAFVFVRLHWLLKRPWIAVLIPCLLFAAGHVSSGIESGRSTWELAAFFVFNSALAAAIFSVVVRSRDVIWIAIPHFVLDIAIDAFG
ncbi:MAG: hypothetical protein ACR2NP_12070 [Pirellulaceae bacterium]